MACIILGITGSIAAYKAADIASALVKSGHEVHCVCTAKALEFVTALTLHTISRNPVFSSFEDEKADWVPPHIQLAQRADLLLVAPATANTLAKMASGIADNLLLTTYLSARCPVAVAPAMDLDMFAHSATQENLRILRSRGVRIVEPAEGELASGLSGKGRMAEPAEIAAYVGTLLAAENPEKKKHLSGKRFVVTAGATIEAIDPVRFISNHSTGKMGYAIAEALARRGAEVVLISGRTSLPTPTGVRRIDVLSAQEMYEASVREFATADGAVMCAAVADYTPEEVAPTKLKKGDGELTIRLKRTHDIAAELGAHKAGRILVGFALETDHEEANAEGKLQRKNFDFIVLNSLRDAGAGFGVDTNKVTLIDRAGREELPLLSKAETAEKIADKIESILK